MILAVGLGGFMLLGVLYGVLVDSQAIARNSPHLLFALIMAGLLAALYRPVSAWLTRLSPLALTPVRWAVSVSALTLAAAVIGLQLAFLN